MISFKSCLTCNSRFFGRSDDDNLCKRCNYRKSSSVASFDDRKLFKKHQELLLSSFSSTSNALKRPNSENNVNNNNNDRSNKSSKNIISSNSNNTSYSQSKTQLKSTVSLFATKEKSASTSIPLLDDISPFCPIQKNPPIKEIMEMATENNLTSVAAVIDISEISKNSDFNHYHQSEKIEEQKEKKVEEKKEELVCDEDPDDHICIVCNQDLCQVADHEAHIASCFGIKLPKSQLFNDMNKDNENGDENDKIETPSGYGLFEDNFMCVICDIELSRKKLIGRIRHLKRCCKKHSVSIRNLLALIAPCNESDEDDKNNDNEDYDDDND